MIDLSANRLRDTAYNRLLLVEDDASVAESLRLLLQKDYEIHTESTIEEGIKRFRTLHPALVVLDLRLPDGEGLDFLREIRRTDKRTPVVILTGYASLRTVEESLRLGATDYLHKPFDGFALRSRLSQLLPQNSKTPAAGVEDAASELCDAQKQIEELKLKADVAAMFLHDLASPVTTALTSSHFLCDIIAQHHSNDSDAMCMAELLTDTMGFLSGLFEQSASIENVKRLPASTIGVGKVVHLPLSLVQQKAESRKVNLGSYIQNPEARICVNHFALVRVLVNLLRNAIEAVEPESGRVILASDTFNGWVKLSVIDNGPGIPDEIKKHVFEQRFTTKKAGTGLGLFIAKHLVVGMGGELTLHSDLGRGCRFSIKLPLLQ